MEEKINTPFNLPKNQELSLPYVMKKILVDKNSIKNFVINEEERRKIRGGKVKEILCQLNQAVHFNSPIVVNEKATDAFHLIDGNHRIEAIKLKIGIDKEFKISLWVAVYRNLNEEERRNIYKLWNIGITQSATDFLKAYWKTIPCGNEMLKRLPITIYGDKKRLSAKLLVGSYINSKKQRNFEGGYGSGKEKTVSDFCDVTSEDISELKEFSDFMEKIFGRYSTESIFYKSTPVAALMRIWYDNKSNKKLPKIFKKEFASKVAQWEQSAKSGGREACKFFYDFAKTRIRKLGVLFDEDLVPKKDKEKEKS